MLFGVRDEETVPVVVTMRVICGCGHAADETYEFDMPADKAVAREAYEPRTCPQVAQLVRLLR
jgi:hypothetical protein